MIAKHIDRDFSAHKQSVYRPYDEYCKLEIFSFDPKYTKNYTVEAKNLKYGSNATKTNWKSWACYRSKDMKNDMVFDITYNARVDGDYRIDYLYEESNHIFGDIKAEYKKFDTSKNLIGHIKVVNESTETTVIDSNVKYYGENNVIKRHTHFLHLNKGKHTISLRIPRNNYFMGMIVRKIVKFVGDNTFGDTSPSEEDNLMVTDVTISYSDSTKPKELTATIGYDDSLVCEDSPSGFYIDYRDEVNYYVKDNDGKVQRIFGGYVSSILPDSNLTKLTLHGADRLSDGQNKYILDQLMMQGGTKDTKTDEYRDAMSKNFDTYPQALKYLCNIHETTLKTNISKNFTVDGEKFHKGIILTYGTKKKIKEIKTTNGITKNFKNHIQVRNQSDGTRKQSWNLYDASKYSKTPPKITDYPYLHITYGMAEPKTTRKVKTEETVSNADTVAGSQKWGKCGVSADKKYIMGIGQYSGSKGTSGLSYDTIYKRIFENKCPHCGGSLVWDSGRSDSDCVHCGGYSHSKREWGDISETEFTCTQCCADYDAITGYEKDSPWKQVKAITKPVQSSRAEQNKLHNGEMVANVNGEEITPDDIFSAITKIAFKYKYRLGTSSSYSEMKKSGYGDCWAFSDLIYTELSKYGVSCQIKQYGTAYASNHQSVIYAKSKGVWADFPYREYGWGDRYDNMLNNTSGSMNGYTVKNNKGTYIGNAKGVKSSTKKQTTEVTITNGYDKDKPFQAYLKLVYSTEPSFKAKKYNLYIHLTHSAPHDPSINNGWSFYWLNNTIKKATLHIKDSTLIDFIRTQRGEDVDVYLQSLHFISPKKQIIRGEDGTVSDDGSWYKVDDSTQDNSSCKMDLYQITFDDNSLADPSELNSCGKTVNAVLKDLVEESGYRVDMTYGLHRKDDIINFHVANQSEPVFTASEGDNNNILAWGNISYSPLSSLYNMSMQVFKGFDGQYYFIDTRDADSILNYGEQCTLETSNESITESEAYFNATKNNKLNPVQTYNYTITVPNYPNLKLGDYVRVYANAKKLNTIKEVESIKVVFDNGKMPRIRTELGLGELAPDLQLKKNIRKLRSDTKKETTSFYTTAIPVTEEMYYQWDR